MIFHLSWKQNWIPYQVLKDPAWSRPQLLLWPHHSTLSRRLTPLILPLRCYSDKQTSSRLRAFAPAVLAAPSTSAVILRGARNSSPHFKSLVTHQLSPSSFLYPLSPYPLYFSPCNNTAWHTRYFLIYLFIGCLFFYIYLFIWLQQVSVAAHGTFNLCCSMKDLFFLSFFSCGIQTLSCGVWI